VKVKNEQQPVSRIAHPAAMAAADSVGSSSQRSRVGSARSTVRARPSSWSSSAMRAGRRAVGSVHAAGATSGDSSASMATTVSPYPGTGCNRPTDGSVAGWAFRLVEGVADAEVVGGLFHG
jgi:hypothetical protein